jgi:hypothetical protein
MRKFKHGDYIIYDDVLYYVSYPDKDGDFIFLTKNDNDRNLHDFNDSYYFSNEKISLIKEEAKKLGFNYYLYPYNSHLIYKKYKFSTKQKLKNILNR